MIVVQVLVCKKHSKLTVQVEFVCHLNTNLIWSLLPHSLFSDQPLCSPGSSGPPPAPKPSRTPWTAQQWPASLIRSCWRTVLLSTSTHCSHSDHFFTVLLLCVQNQNKITVPASHITDLSPLGSPENVLKKWMMSRLFKSHLTGQCAGQDRNS